MTPAPIAYAIYLLSREGVVTTNYIINLRDYLDKNFAKEWKADLTGVYLAGALHILQKEDEAVKLIGAYRVGQFDKKQIDGFLPAARRRFAIRGRSCARIPRSPEKTSRGGI